MQLPGRRTPVAQCERLALYTTTMLKMFPKNLTLAALAEKLSGGMTALTASQRAYADQVISLVVPRVHVKFVDYISDQAVRALQNRAELADGRKDGKIASMLFPGGVTPIVQPVGATQVAEMRDLEGRLEPAKSIWADAPKEKEAITGLRQQYETALAGRRAAREKASDLRVARNGVKEDFLDIFSQVASRIGEEFPRDRRAQDLFFDKIERRARSAGAADDEGEEADDTAPPASTTTE